MDAKAHARSVDAAVLVRFTCALQQHRRRRSWDAATPVLVGMGSKLVLLYWGDAGRRSRRMGHQCRSDVSTSTVKRYAIRLRPAARADHESEVVFLSRSGEPRGIIQHRL